MRRKTPEFLLVRDLEPSDGSEFQFLIGKAVLLALLEEGHLNALQYKKAEEVWRKRNL